MKQNPKIPAGYQTVMPYLLLHEAQSFIDFVKKVFHANEQSKQMRDEKLIAHAEVTIGDSTIMFADVTDQWEAQSAGLFVYVDNADETYKKALQEGATVIMEPADQPYGRSCGVKDPSGNTWWITTPG